MKLVVTTPVVPGGDMRYDVSEAPLSSKYQLAIDGAGYTSNEARPAPDGTFHGGMNVGTVEKTQQVTVRDAATKKVVAGPVPVVVKKVVDPPPVIGTVTVSAITQTSATIGWGVSEPATGQVDYGTVIPYSGTSTLEPNLLTAHVQTITGLQPNTLYHYRVRSKDSAGQETASPDRTLQTLAVPPPPIVVGPTPNIPSSIDATGQADVTSALQTAIGNLLAGHQTVVFPQGPGPKYRVDGMLHYVASNGLHIVGNGSEIVQKVEGTNPIWQIDGGGSDFSLRGFRITGAAPSPGTHDYPHENNHVIRIGGVHGVDIGDLVTRNMGGDTCNLEGSVWANTWGEDILIENVDSDGVGRMFVSFTDGARRVVVQKCKIAHVAWYPFDIEPNGYMIAGEPATAQHVKIIDNILGLQPYGRYPEANQADGLVFAITGTSNAQGLPSLPVIDIEFSRNVMTDPAYGALKVGVYNNGGVTSSQIKLDGNVGVQRKPGPTMSFSGVNGLILTNNTQPLSQGVLASLNGCSNVAQSGNTTT